MSVPLSVVSSGSAVGATHVSFEGVPEHVPSASWQCVPGQCSSSRHSTQRPLAPQYGSGAAQSPSPVHSTHTPSALHTGASGPHAPQLPPQPSGPQERPEHAGTQTRGGAPGLGWASAWKSTALSPVSPRLASRVRLWFADTAEAGRPSPPKVSVEPNSPYPTASSTSVPLLSWMLSGPFW